MDIKKWLTKNTHDLTGITVAITGSTGGIGEELSTYLASINANLIFLNRDERKSIDLMNKISENYPSIKIEFIKLDLADFNNVKIVTNQLKSYKLDILILNAGVYNVARYRTNIGFDNIFQVNFVSQYYLAKELIPTLKKSNYSKVVAVGSIAHNYSKIDKLDIDFSKKRKPSLVYGNSKRFLMFGLAKLFSKEDKIKFSLVHPGITLTEMTNHYPKAINWLVKIGIKILFPSPKKAVLSILKGLFDTTPNLTWIGPKTFNIWGKPAKTHINTTTTKECQDIDTIASDIYNKLIKRK